MGRAHWRGYSQAVSKDSHIAQNRGLRIFVDIPTEDNRADVETRPGETWREQEIERRRLATFERCKAAWNAWQEWPGKMYFGRRDAVFTRSSVPHAHESLVFGDPVCEGNDAPDEV